MTDQNKTEISSSFSTTSQSLIGTRWRSQGAAGWLFRIDR